MANQISSPKRFPGPDPLDQIGVCADPNLLDGNYIEVYRQLFGGDQTTTVQPYMALASELYGVLRDNNNPAATAPVVVPFWAAQAITKGFMIYRDAILTGQEMRFGVAMGLEYKSKGSKPRLVKETRRLRDWKLALAVLLRVESGEKRTAAINVVAEEFLVSASTAWRIWSKHKEFVIDHLDKFRTLKS
jgi:hypothetical protein